MRAFALVFVLVAAGCITTVPPPATNTTTGGADGGGSTTPPSPFPASFVSVLSSASLSRVFHFRANATVAYESWGTGIPTVRESGPVVMNGAYGNLTTPSLGRRAVRIVDAQTLEIAGERYVRNPNPPSPPSQEAAPSGPKCVSTLAAREAARPTWVLDTSMGTMRVTLFCDRTPRTGQNFVNLTEAGYFDGTKFHRVIENFMNQGGDPLTKNDTQAARWGTGGPGYTIVDEFWCADGKVSTTHPATCGAAGLGLKHDGPGVLSMANTGRPRTGGSQFFLTAVATPHLDGKHAVFGHMTDAESLRVALEINKVDTNSADRPIVPVVLRTATIEWG